MQFKPKFWIFHNSKRSEPSFSLFYLSILYTLQKKLQPSVIKGVVQNTTPPGELVYIEL